MSHAPEKPKPASFLVAPLAVNVIRYNGRQIPVYSLVESRWYKGNRRR